MFRRVAVVGVLGTILSLFALPAVAAEAKATAPKPLSLTMGKLGLSDPEVPTVRDGGQPFCAGDNSGCGILSLSVSVSGFQGRGIEPPEFEPVIAGSVSAAVRVTRVYGCQSASGRRLATYDTKVKETAHLSVRHGIPILLFRGYPDKVDLVLLQGLGNVHPGNCPAGATAMNYSVTAKLQDVTFSSSVASIPTTRYPVCGKKVRWTGAVPTPVAPV